MFRTSDYIFRRSVMGEALRAAGVTREQTLVREPRIEIHGTHSHVIKPRLDK